MEYTIKDNKEGFTTFIEELRRKLADHEHRENVWDDHHPVLGRRRLVEEQPARWFHIKLQLRDEQTSTTLAVRDDTVDVVGFMNQYGSWYKIADGGRSSTLMLPPEYESVSLDWGESYKDLLQVPSHLQAMEKLDSAGLGRDFATKAVRTLSCYRPDVQVQQEGDLIINDPRLALAGLIFMIKESARFNTFRDRFAHVWDSDTGARFSMQELMCCNIYNWVKISRALLRWKKDGYPTWSPEAEHDYLEKMGFVSAKNALDAVGLVYNLNFLF